MKKLILLSALLFSMVIPQLSVAIPQASRLVTTRDTSVQDLPIEVSELLVHPDYQRLLNAQAHKAAQENRSLRITGFYVQNIGSETFVYAHLAVSDAALPPQGEMQWHEVGAIVGVVVYGPRGEVIVNSVFFEPPAVPPGGASIGNN